MEHSDFGISPGVLNNPWYLAFNMNHPIVSDLNFRRAVAHALEREDIAAYARGIEGAPETTGTFWGYAMEFKNTDIPIIPFDLEIARQYLEASSYNGEEIELIASVQSNVRAAEMLEQQLGRIGINIVVRQMDGPGLSAMVANPGATHVMVVHTASLSSDASDMRTLLHSTAPNNRAAYSNPRVDELLDLGVTITNVAEREAVYREIQEIIAESIPYINLYRTTMNFIHARGVGGLVVGNEIAMVNYRGVFLDLDA